MKRLFQILGLLIVLLVATLIILPIVFKDEIVDRVKQEINNNVNATVEFEEISLSLFKSFPNFNLGISKFTVDGVDEFKGVRLADIDQFEVELNIMSVIFGDQFEVESIDLNDASIHALVTEEGKANYDIAKSSGDEKPEEVEVKDTTSTDESSSSSFKLSLKHYGIQNFNLNYEDKQGNLKAIITDLDHIGNGDFSQEIVNLETETSIKGITVENGGVSYLKKVGISSDFDVEFNQTESKITLGENNLGLNDLVLKFTGFVKLPSEDSNMDMDLEFSTPQSSFKSVISLIPGVFYKDFESIKTEGSFGLKGKVAGTFDGEKEVYPSFDVLFNIDNGSVQYPDLPASVSGITVNTHIYNKSTNLDGTIVDVSKIEANVANSPIKANLLLSTPISDPNISAGVSAHLDLADLAKAVPMVGLDYSGKIDGELGLKAKMSDVENEDFEKVTAEGSLNLANLSITGDSVPVKVNIPSAIAEFSPQFVDLKELSMTLGKSDIQAKGKMDNMLAFVLKDEVLHARFDVNSGLLDLNDLSASVASEEVTDTATIAEKSTNAPTATDTTALSAIRIPENIDFELSSNFQKVLFADLVINDLQGNIILKEGEVRMDKVNMNTLGGSLALDGGYNSKPEKPEVDFDLAIKDFGFKESYDAFEMVREMAPIMGKTEGKFSTSFTLASELNQDMTPDLNSVLAAGTLFSKGIKTSPNSLKELADVLKNPSLATLDIGKLDLKFKIENGKLTVEPFDVNAGNVSAKVYGSQSLDQTMDYTMDMKIPASGLSASGLLNGIVNNSGKIDLAVKVGGTTSDPKITTSLGDLVDNVIDNLTNAVEEKVNEVIEDVENKVNEEVEKLIKQAAEEGDKLVAEAQKQAQALRDGAKKEGDKIRKEANDQADKLIKDAKGDFLKEIGAKEAAKAIRETGEETAKGIEEEADKQANALVQAAKDEKERMVKEAEKLRDS